MVPRSGVDRLIELALLAYLIQLPLLPLIGETGAYLAVGILLVGLVLSQLAGPGPDTNPTPLLWPTLGFAATAGLAILFSTDPELSLDRALYTPIGVCFFFAAQRIGRSRSGLQHLAWTSLGIVIVLGVDGLAQTLTGQSLISGRAPVQGRVAASLPHPNDLALISILLPLAAIPLLRASSIPRMCAGLLAMAPALVTVVFSQSRNAWLGVVLGAGVLAGLERRRRTTILAGALVAGLLLLSWAAGSEPTREIAQTAELGEVLAGGGVADRLGSFPELLNDGRIGLWLCAWQMFLDAPLLGQGVHRFGDLYLVYLAETTLPDGYRPEIAMVPWAHNLYLELLAERGLVGLASFAVLIVAATRLLLRIRPRLPASLRPSAHALAASCCTFLGMGLFDLTFLKDWVTLIFFLLVGLVAGLASQPTCAGSALGVRVSAGAGGGEADPSPQRAQPAAPRRS